MKYTEEIFNILSKGGFISANSVSPVEKPLNFAPFGHAELSLFAKI